MAKAKKHNQRAKKLKARKAGSASKRNSSYTSSKTPDFAALDAGGYDSFLDLVSNTPALWIKEDNQWNKKKIY